ncbi:PAAR domain-containing protein [Propionibacteriaceae bacterium Y2011]|uniref:PAAR domain-containing protein n=1 Tax=Microlunatus sp. Y2014 TaxID=3418488 RepID=UPI003B4D2E23
MPQPAARQTDQVVGTDIHVVMVPSPGGPVPTPTPHPFVGTLQSQCSTDVLINGMGAAVQGSVARLTSPHLPIGGPSFLRPPTGQGTVMMGSPTVLVNGKPLARLGDQVMTCNDPADAPTSAIAAGSPNVVVA